MDSSKIVPMKPPHKNFFSSLKQVEKRLKLDDGNLPPPPPPPPPPETTETQPSESSTTSSPIYFHTHHTNTLSSTFNSTSQPPQEFLSYNDTNDFQSNRPKPYDSEHGFSPSGAVDDIHMMIKILRLNDFDGKGPKMPELVDGEFYDKVVKVKGPRCKKEVERLDRWIEYFLKNSNGGKVLEPFRLAHLVLAKAAFVSGGGGGGDEDGLEFPSTVDEFLQNDPPSD